MFLIYYEMFSKKTTRQVCVGAWMNGLLYFMDCDYAVCLEVIGELDNRLHTTTLAVQTLLADESIDFWTIL